MGYEADFQGTFGKMLGRMTFFTQHHPLTIIMTANKVGVGNSICNPSK